MRATLTEEIRELTASAEELLRERPTLIKTPTVHAKGLFQFGVWASALYAGALGIYALFVMDNMLDMKPSEFAEFLAGVFAPLAFLWLVLGFRQQGDELQNSARALWLQGEELRNSVEQQRQLVAVSREQLAAEFDHRRIAETEAENAAQPQLSLVGGGSSSSGQARTFDLVAYSGGPPCSAFEIWVDGKRRLLRPMFDKGGALTIQNQYGSPDEVQPITVQLRYIDRRGNHRAQNFFVPTDETGGPHRDRVLAEPVKLPGVEPLDPVD